MSFFERADQKIYIEHKKYAKNRQKTPFLCVEMVKKQ